MGTLMAFLQAGRPKGTMKFPHLKGREKLLRPLGFTRQRAEWITLVCLHSGLFTRDQVEALFRKECCVPSGKATVRFRYRSGLLYTKTPCRPIVASLWVQKKSNLRLSPTSEIPV